MRERNYIKKDAVVGLLKSGWEIFTHRSSGPANALHFRIYKDEEDSKPIHHQTMAKLLRENILKGYEAGHDKYKLTAEKPDGSKTNVIKKNRRN